MGELAISVVMPTFNRASYISEALDSVMRQMAPPVEVLVVDDGSTDNTREVVAKHAFARRIRYHLQPDRGGASVARNAGVRMARGDVVVFLDSDDILEPEHHLQVLKTFATSPQVGLYCCDSWTIGPGGESLSDRTWTAVQADIRQWEIHSGERSLQDIFLFSTPFPGMALRRSVYEAVGGLDQNLFPLDDLDLQLRVAGAGYGVYYEHVPRARYRIHGANESGRRQAIKVCERKLHCIVLAQRRFVQIRGLPGHGRRRRGEVRRELALALLRERRLRAGMGALLYSLAEDPGGIHALARLAGRQVRRLMLSGTAGH